MLVTDDGAAGSDLVATSRVLAAALEREGADLVLFGQQASDSDGAVLWAAVADRLRRPLISQVAELTVEGGKARGKRQTEFGYDVIEAPLPAVIAVSDAINEPRYPSLKGIMGAKKKPQDTRLARRPRRRAAPGEARLEDGGARARRPARRAATRSKIEDDGSAAEKIVDVPRREEARLMTTLVFLEHHEGELAEGLARRSRQGRRSSAATSQASSSAPASRELAAQAGEHGAATVYVADDPALEAPLPQPRVDVLAALVRDKRLSTTSSSRSPCSPPTSPPGSPPGSTPG